MLPNAETENHRKSHRGREHTQIQIMEVYIQLIPANTQNHSATPQSPSYGS